MKRTLAAFCCIALASLPLVAQKKAAGKAMTDQQFVEFAAQTDMMEANLGQLAANAASSQQVKDYASTLVTEHTTDYGQLSTAAKQANLNVPNAIDTEHNKMLAPFQKLKKPLAQSRITIITTRPTDFTASELQHEKLTFSQRNVRLCWPCVRLPAKSLQAVAMVVVLATPLPSFRIARPYHVRASKPPILANHPPKSVDGQIGNRVQNIWHIRVLKSLNCALNKKHWTSNWLKPGNERPSSC